MLSGAECDNTDLLNKILISMKLYFMKPSLTIFIRFKLNISKTFLTIFIKRICNVQAIEFEKLIYGNLAENQQSLTTLIWIKTGIVLKITIIRTSFISRISGSVQS